ncbi:MAG TPA: hypothetical protein VES61_01240 [Gaiellaceae bacterium]|nr:hypothetical protein [Gaiellaceae bacterium]
MTTAEKYVTAAYLVVLAVVLLYVVIYAFKLARLEREVSRLARLAAERRASGDKPTVEPAEPVRTAT